MVKYVPYSLSLYTTTRMDISKVQPYAWSDDRLVVRASHIHDHGIFTTAPIAAGEVIMIWGDTFFDEIAILNGHVLRQY